MDFKLPGNGDESRAKTLRTAFWTLVVVGILVYGIFFL
jgi:hypothetical protein